MEEYVYGLDFGTSTTLMAIPREGMPQILPIGRSDNWMPSLIGLGDGGDVVVGDFASDKPHGDQIRSPKTAITREQFGNLVSPSGKTIEAEAAHGKIFFSFIVISSSSFSFTVAGCGVFGGVSIALDFKWNAIALFSVASR